MSTTVLKALALIPAAGARKFPAAAAMTMSSLPNASTVPAIAASTAANSRTSAENARASPISAAAA